MSIKSAKAKGSAWEHDAVEYLNSNIKGASFKRIPGSGALGTNCDEPLLTGDISGSIEGFPKKFRIEAKVGYGGAKQFTLKKEWIEKIRQEAFNTYSMPMLLGKFSGGTRTSKTFVVMSMEDFAEFVNLILGK